MSDPPLASVIVNNYNYARFLREAVDSALNQTYPNTEVIVVDDGSTDGSREIIANYGDRIIPVLKENGGQNSALNAGFSQSRGKVIFFLDADDAMLPTAAEAAMELFGESDVAKVHWPLVELDECSRETGRIWWGRLPEGNMRNVLVDEGPDGVAYPPTSGNAFARSFLESIFPLPDVWPKFVSRPSARETRWMVRPGPDLYLSTLAVLHGRIKRLAKPQAFYRVHGQNGYSSLKFEDRLAFDLALFDHASKAAAEYCKRLQISVDPELWRTRSWAHRIYRATLDIATLVPFGATFILVDGDEWKTDPLLAGRKRIPFLEHDGQYWGNPEDDATAIRELERLREAGASFIVFAWSRFWWLEYYSELYRYLRTQFRCVRDDERITAFDLRAQGTHLRREDG
jgi:hypothetical protein